MFAVMITSGTYDGWWVSNSRQSYPSVASGAWHAEKFWTPWGAWKAKIRFLSKTKIKTEVRFLLFNLF